jgi:hypothetical protein
MSTIIHYVDRDGTWYETDERRREGGKTSGIYTLCNDYNITWLTHNLSEKVRCLKLSPKILFYLMHYEIVSPSLENVNQGFNKRLDDFSFGKAEPVMRRRDGKMVWRTIPPSSLFKTHQRIEQEAVIYIHEHRNLWSLWNSLPDRFKEFRAISEEIIRNTNPKEARWADLSKKQKEWFYWGSDGIPPNPIVWVGQGGPPTLTFKGVLEHMLTEHSGMTGQLSKYKVMNKWLEKNYPRLHAFYLNGEDGIGVKQKLAPSIGERLQGLDILLVNSKYVDLAMIEIAFSQLKRLIEEDLLFTCVFYSYFYRPKRGRPPKTLVKEVINRIRLPLIEALKGFGIRKPIPNALQLLNALAGEEVYPGTSKGIDLLESDYKRDKKEQKEDSRKGSKIA